MIAYQLERANAVEEHAATSGQPSDSEPSPTAAAAPQQAGKTPAAAAGAAKTKRPLPPASCLAMATAAADGVCVGDAGAKGLGAFAARNFDAEVTVGDYQGEWLSTRYSEKERSALKKIKGWLTIVAFALRSPLRHRRIGLSASRRDLDARYPHTCAPLPPGAPARPPPTMVSFLMALFHVNSFCPGGWLLNSIFC